MGKIIAFGDIHGCYKAAETAIKLTKEKKANAVFLGDYIDRGPDSIKTLEVLIEAKKQNPDWVFLRGNHDQMLIDLICGKTDPNIEFEVPNGKTSNEETSKVFFKWQNSPELLKNKIVSFLKCTKVYHETEHWIYVHAPLKDSENPLDKKSQEELIWNYDLNPNWEGKPFIHGHKTTVKVLKTGKGININTKCGYGGKLTGLLVDNGSGEIKQEIHINENGSLK